MRAFRRLADSLSYATDGSPFLGAGIHHVQSRVANQAKPDNITEGVNSVKARRTCSEFSDTLPKL